MSSVVELKNLILYAKTYLGMVNPVRQRSSLKTDQIKPHILSLNDILAAVDEDDISYGIQLGIKCELFYESDLKKIEELEGDNKKEFEYQRRLLNVLDEIKLKVDTDSFTKQTQLNLGYVDLVAKDVLEVEGEDEADESIKKKIQFPVFTIPIEIENNGIKKQITLLDDRITPSFSFMSQVLGADRYQEFQKRINSMELEGKFTLPVDTTVIQQVYEELLNELRLCEEVVFSGEPLNLAYLSISLAPKSNFFLTQDLDNLVDTEQDELLETSLSGFVDERELDETIDINSSEGSVYFPFLSDKYQREVLAQIKNRASIIQGPPGTGKSQTIANLLCHLAANDKKVLFVSQKDQAIRVVKDLLKSLDIPGLYGYIPDRYSALHTLNDDVDGAANELSRIKSVIEDRRRGTFEQEPNKSIESVVNEYNDQFQNQRKYFELKDKLNNLDEFNVKISQPEKFITASPLERINDIRKTLKHLKEMKEFVASNHKTHEKIFNKLGYINMEYYVNSAGHIEQMKTSLMVQIKDSGFSITRKLHNRVSLSKQKNVSNNLPVEVRNYISEILDEFNRSPSKTKLGSQLQDLILAFQSEETRRSMLEYETHAKKNLQNLGLKSDEYTEIVHLIQKHGDSAIDKVIESIELKQEIDNLRLKDINSLNKEVHKSRKQYQEFVKNSLRNKTSSRLDNAWAHATVRQNVERAVRTFKKSKRAYKTYDSFRSDPAVFKTILDLFPMWLMSLEDVSRIVPSELNIFDYVIIDEASQCNLAYAIPAMSRARHTLLFGDTLQMRDTTIKFKSNNALLEMARKYSIPEELQIKSESDSVKSVMDIGILQGFRSSVLRSHYRSPRELIGFSNEYFYRPRKRTLEIVNASLTPYKDTNRVLVNHIIDSNRSRDESLKTNVDEAEYICNLIREIKMDEQTKDMSIGVLSFFTEQAELLRRMIDDKSIKVSNIEGIQGDEREIIIYSFAISDPSEKSRYISLTGEGGEINRELNEGRVNVAFSRAKHQVHCVTSLRPEQWPEGIWIKRYLEYVEENGKASRMFSDGVDTDMFDSNFERDFYELIVPYLKSNHLIQNQVESCGFKIDFAIHNKINGKKLAIECDGPTHFEDEIEDVYVQSDWERQSILEAAKWKFYRIPYSKWDGSYDRGKHIDEILSALDN
ncbi:AAA family ATPase [Candidatus Parcubacteria bacterium]|nr:AAA family ATPase [Candidatus Parcubacteria bacterium]